jgi:hypothetical protein
VVNDDSDDVTSVAFEPISTHPRSLPSLPPAPHPPRVTASRGAGCQATDGDSAINDPHFQAMQ